LTAMIL